jgi:glutathione synthase/RimK-type ligase-like ATP-grasp enzyme
MLLTSWFQLLCLCSIGFCFPSQASSPISVLLIDPFSEYLSARIKQDCADRGVNVIELVSPYMSKVLDHQGRTVPEKFQIPVSSSKLNERCDEWKDSRIECVICESEAGLPMVGPLQSALGLPLSNEMTEKTDLRSKFAVNSICRASGLDTVEQICAHDWGSAKNFAQMLIGRGKKCIVKPVIGVSTDGVHLCEKVTDVEQAFNRLLGTHRYGGGSNDVVLLQEYLTGEEYAVDTVSRDGEVKITAIWKYHKRPANGAPFVYQGAELIPCEDDAGEVADYCIRALNCIGHRYGPAHTEIIMTSDGPRLVEINLRWHNANFHPIVTKCIGYDALSTTLDAYLDPEKFNAIPQRPTLTCNGMIVHLISTCEGKLARFCRLNELHELKSVLDYEFFYGIGSQVKKTVDITTDSGYVLLCNEDRKAFDDDFEKLKELQFDFLAV